MWIRMWKECGRAVDNMEIPPKHRKVGKKSGLHSKIIECLFCEEIIKLSDFVESLEKLLTFQI